MSKDNEEGKKKRPQNDEFIRAISYFSHIGITMGASVLIGVLLGRYLDGLLGTSPWLLLLFSFSGVGAAIKSLFNTPQNRKRQSDKD